MTEGSTYPIWFFIVVIIAAIAITFALQKKKEKTGNLPDEQNSTLTEKVEQSIMVEPSNPRVEFSYLSALSPDEESCLIEIKDLKLLERIDQAIPGTLQAVANTGAVHAYHQAVESAGQLYQAIIPQGAKLTHSLDMDGAVRGFYHGADGIKGHANFVAVDGNPANGLVLRNT